MEKEFLLIKEEARITQNNLTRLKNALKTVQSEASENSKSAEVTVATMMEEVGNRKMLRNTLISLEMKSTQSQTVL